MKDVTSTIRDNLLATLAACQADGIPFKPTKLELEYMKRAKDWKLPTVERSVIPREWGYVSTLHSYTSEVTYSEAMDHMKTGAAYIQTKDPYFLTLWEVPGEEK